MKKSYCLEGDVENNPLMDLLCLLLKCELLAGAPAGPWSPAEGLELAALQKGHRSKAFARSAAKSGARGSPDPSQRGIPLRKKRPVSLNALPLFISAFLKKKNQDKDYASFADVESAFASKELHPSAFKPAVQDASRTTPL